MEWAVGTLPVGLPCVLLPSSSLACSLTVPAPCLLAAPTAPAILLRNSARVQTSPLPPPPSHPPACLPPRRSYRTALREFPTCPADVRLGLAACYFKLGSSAKAAAAYERVLELDPGCTQALLGLAVLKLGLGASKEVRAVRAGTYSRWSSRHSSRRIEHSSSAAAGIAGTAAAVVYWPS